MTRVSQTITVTTGEGSASAEINLGGSASAVRSRSYRGAEKPGALAAQRASYPSDRNVLLYELPFGALCVLTLKSQNHNVGLGPHVDAAQGFIAEPPGQRKRLVLEKTAFPVQLPHVDCKFSQAIRRRGRPRDILSSCGEYRNHLEISKRLAAPFWEHDNLKGERGEADVPSDAKAERGGIRADLATPGLTIEGFSTL